MSLRIEEVLDRRGISTAELARRVGVSRSSMFNTIKKGNITVNMLERISDAIGIPITDLFAKPSDSKFTCPNCGATLEVDIRMTGEKTEKE